MDGRPFHRPQWLSWELRLIARPWVGTLFARTAPRQGIRWAFRRGFYRRNRLPPDVWQEITAAADDAMKPRIGAAYFQHFVPGLAEFERRAGELRAPLLVLWGEHDVFIHRATGEELARVVPGARFEVIAEAGHFVHLEKPEEVAQRLEAFLAA
jgi:pimeloyl-ACP methyl ester carboxylesterase